MTNLADESDDGLCFGKEEEELELLSTVLAADDDSALDEAEYPSEDIRATEILTPLTAKRTQGMLFFKLFF